jgi:membrane protease YdiL (CAAX protease family)
MENTIDSKRISVFLGIAFGIAWVIALIVALTGGLVNSPELVPNTGITLALILVALGYMWAPALAHFLTRLITREGWQNIGLSPRFKGAFLYWVIAWIAPAVLTILGAILYFILLPNNFDADFTVLNQLLAGAENTQEVEPWVVFLIEVAGSILTAPLINSIFTFGEEFGWRGYLLQKLMPMGARKAMVALGVIWGVWHWPMIAMGHNYGLDYLGAPWLGMVIMVWFTFTNGVFLSFVTLRSKSVWPAVIGHAAINGIANIGSLFLKGQPTPLLGPLPVGLIGSAAWSVLAMWLTVNTKVLTGEET